MSFPNPTKHLLSIIYLGKYNHNLLFNMFKKCYSPSTVLQTIKISLISGRWTVFVFILQYEEEKRK